MSKNPPSVSPDAVFEESASHHFGRRRRVLRTISERLRANKIVSLRSKEPLVFSLCTYPEHYEHVLQAEIQAFERCRMCTSELESLQFLGTVEVHEFLCKDSVKKVAQEIALQSPNLNYDSLVQQVISAGERAKLPAGTNSLNSNL